jgi:hypothetical protein
MKQSKFGLIVVRLLCGACLLATPVFGYAQDVNNNDNWQFIGSIYLWGAGIEAKTQRGSEIDIGFSDLVDNLDFAFMGGLEARKSKWPFLGDFVYLDLGHEKGATLPIGPGVSITTDADVKGWVINLLAGYNLSHTPTSLVDVVFGARYLELETSINTSLAGGQPRERSKSGNVWDGVIGIRGKQYFSEKWYIPYYLDIGTGDSDQTWQGVVGIAYQLKRWDLALAYRHIEWELSPTEKLITLISVDRVLRPSFASSLT